MRTVLTRTGTWLNADNGMNNGELAIPSNVTRISRAIRPMSKDGIPQVVYYQFGVGSRGNVLDKIVGGTTGSGIEENVREAYAFLSNNYSPGDEIILIGFSRGAFTARSVAGLICEIGMLTKKGLPAFVPIFEDVQHRRDHKYKDKNPTIPFSNKPNACDPRYREELERRGLTDLDVTVKAIGVWDTVGSLGAPRIGWLTRVGIQPTQSHEMKFYDTKLSNSIEHAFQALALDEKRAAFAPAVWEKPRGNTTVLRQVWFPGVHSNIGGGYDDQQLANITLAWMAAQLSPFLDFRTKYLLAQDDAAARYYVKRHETPRPWAFGTIPNSAMGLYALAGTTARCPGTYHAVDPHTGRVTPRPLRDTCEYVHPSVRARLRLGGPGEADKGKYSAGPLTRAWRLVVGESEGEDGAPSVVWRPVRGREVESGAPKVLPESPLWRLERELCARDPETFDYVVAPPRTRGRDKAHARRRRSRSRAGGEGRDRSEWRRSVG
ncbi:uncharacterized protein K452DRAFT_157262 [Aplosporella prunicola CBS 121167]|uniref:T6SS Phospholipase effector Tle1-like catalytic domain-containing protein n=1 Tax=Aplosporella prunicola CBS 121167 TaxID=1176127 RepID=A0A6A6AXE2_9PEZI|nr:uncharacterized protein K452DRAFT_157262 [Aplosporella prunicola CBS 121167]KAF2135928.1 hypothetical protein K452DRAFT_157262 [Aplosporella prunicola CBS 121167]